MAKTPVPETNYSPRWTADERPKLPFVGPERALLIDYLEYYRKTV